MSSSGLSDNSLRLPEELAAIDHMKRQNIEAALSSIRRASEIVEQIGATADSQLSQRVSETLLSIIEISPSLDVLVYFEQKRSWLDEKVAETLQTKIVERSLAHADVSEAKQRLIDLYQSSGKTIKNKLLKQRLELALISLQLKEMQPRAGQALSSDEEDRSSSHDENEMTLKSLQNELSKSIQQVSQAVWLNDQSGDPVQRYGQEAFVGSIQQITKAYLLLNQPLQAASFAHEGLKKIMAIADLVKPFHPDERLVSLPDHPPLQSAGQQRLALCLGESLLRLGQGEKSQQCLTAVLHWAEKAASVSDEEKKTEEWASTIKAKMIFIETMTTLAECLRFLGSNLHAEGLFKTALDDLNKLKQSHPFVRTVFMTEERHLRNSFASLLYSLGRKNRAARILEGTAA